MIKYYTLLLILFYSCGTKLNYLGSSYTPSKNVDVYVDASAIKKPYTIIGKGYMVYGYGFDSKSRIEDIQERAIKKAKEKGADAILFNDYYIKEDGASIHSVTKTDSIGKGLITVQSGSVGPVISSKRDILFLKYN